MEQKPEHRTERRVFEGKETGSSCWFLPRDCRPLAPRWRPSARSAAMLGNRIAVPAKIKLGHYPPKFVLDVGQLAPSLLLASRRSLRRSLIRHHLLEHFRVD